MIGWVTQVSGWLLNQVKVNHVRPALRDGRRVFIKHRRAIGPLLIWFGNRLLVSSGSGMTMIPRVDEWLHWETHCFARLYPDQPPARIEGDRSLIVPALDGVSLRTLLDRDEDSATRACVLAARELRRAHTVQTADASATWSHGDLHLDNILVDLSAGRAYLIDFDIRHNNKMAAIERHADDLRSILLAVVGRPDESWRVTATTFLSEYDEPPVLTQLGRQLAVPRGFARVLLSIKANGAPLSRVQPRLEGLQRVICEVTGATP